MKLMEFIDIIRKEINNAKIEKYFLIIYNLSSMKEKEMLTKNIKLLIANIIKYHYYDILFIKKEDKNVEYEDIDILNSENNIKNFLTFLQTIKPNISLSSIKSMSDLNSTENSQTVKETINILNNNINITNDEITIQYNINEFNGKLFGKKFVENNKKN